PVRHAVRGPGAGQRAAAAAAGGGAGRAGCRGPALGCRQPGRADLRARRRAGGVSAPPVARPESGPPRPWRFPAFDRRTVAGGTVLACDLPGRLLATVLLVLDAGAVTEPAGREGVAL